MTEKKKWENIFLEDCAEYDKKIKEEQIEQKAEEYFETETPMIENITGLDFQNEVTKAFQKGAEFGYNKCKEEIDFLNRHWKSEDERKEEYEGKCKTAYIKGIRTMANALKDYDRTNGAWTDYFEHTVEEVLKRLLQEIE